MDRGPGQRPQGRRSASQATAPARTLIADRGYDSNAYRATLRGRSIKPCIPTRKCHKHPIPQDQVLYRKRHKIENMFAKLKDWRRIAMSYDRCATTFMVAIIIDATMIFWLKQ